jgi:alpha-tubulin suppressor-like RCC1 family protein
VRVLGWSLGWVLVGCLAGCGDDSLPTELPASPSPSVATTITLTWTQVAAGGQHTCALASNGRAYCWGQAIYGAVGNGTSPLYLAAPTRVAGNLTFVQITAGLTHSCAVTADGKAYCWGENLAGQLGDGTTTTRLVPVRVEGGHRFTRIRAGGTHTCATTSAGKAFCWGNNGNGQLGDGTTNQHLVPVAVVGGLTFKRVIAGGTHTCGVSTAGKAYCWGRGSEGQLGQNARTGSMKPVAVAGGLTFESVVAGSDHTCGVTTMHRGYCWGSISDYNTGQLGNGTTGLGAAVPIPIAGARKWTQVIAGYTHTCGVTETSVAFCWGFNFYGQNGDGTERATFAPTRVLGGITFIGVSTGSQRPPPFVSDDAIHSCGITANGRIYCWGSDALGELGDGLASPARVFAPVQALMPT